MKAIERYVNAKKYLVILSMFCMLFGCVRSVSAASYPLLVAEKYNIECNAGDEISIGYRYYPEFKNERIETKILNSSGEQVASADNTMYNTSKLRTYTLTWDTTGKKPGKYTVVSYMHFYSMYEWHTAPTPTTSYVTINCAHTWNNGVITTQPTCVKTGIKTYTCTICQETKQEEVASTGIHKWNAGVITTPPTATEDGIRTFSCINCNNTKTEKIPSTKELKNTSVNAHFKILESQIDGENVVEYVKPVNKNTTSIIIPDTVEANGVVYKVTSVSANAFKNNKKIKKVKIGSNVITIGSNAFSGCKNLTSVTIGSNVTTIGTKDFYKCTSLKKITIPSKVTKIGKQAFYGCKQLKGITIKTKRLTSKSIGSNAFKDIYSKATVKVPSSKLKSYKKILKSKGVSSKAKIKK